MRTQQRQSSQEQSVVCLEKGSRQILNTSDPSERTENALKGQAKAGCRYQEQDGGRN